MPPIAKPHRSDAEEVNFCRSVICEALHNIKLTYSSALVIVFSMV